MSFIRRHRKRLFWATIGLVLLLGVGQIRADPTRFSSERATVVISEFLAAPPQQTGVPAAGVPEAGVPEAGVPEAGVPEAEDPLATNGWIELYNRSGQAVDLANWTLTDDPADPEKWTFPAVTINGGDYLLVWTKDAAPAETEEQALQANVALNPQGGFLALYPPTVHRFADAASINYPPQLANTTFGRPDPTKGAEFSYLAAATPGRLNDSNVSWIGMTEPVVASVERGFFQEPFSVNLTSETVDAEIRYTLDGSTPTAEQGLMYTDEIAVRNTTILRAIAIKAGYLSGAVTTHSYIFPEDVIAQPQNPAENSNIGWPDTWGTHRITLFGYEKGEPVVADYEMDPEVTQDPAYRPQMVESLLAIPSVSLVTDMDNLDIYFVDPQMRGLPSERPASVEFLYPNGDHENFQSGAGLRIQGGAGRWEHMPKHSFRLLFKQQYGAAKLQHKLFDDSRLTSFNTLTLRGGVNRSFAGHPNTLDETKIYSEHQRTTYTRDEWARDSQIAMSGVGSHGTFMHLYLNGLYWGLYNLVERPDQNFAADYYGGDDEEWFTATHGGAGDGKIDRFTVMLQLAAAGGLADPDKYATMLEFVDPVHFSDYLILNWYMGTRDWPENNWYTNVQYPAGRNLFFVWDAENSWDEGAELRLGSAPKEGAPLPNVAKLVFDALIENDEYRRLLADRLSKHLRNGGVLTDAAAQARWRAIAEPLETAIIAESARWGDARYDEPITQRDWRIANEDVLNQMKGNAEKLLQQARDAGYYPPVDPPLFSQHGGSFADQLSLALSAEGAETGAIYYYTLDGSDPSQPNALVYASPIPITTATTVKARRLTNGVWSALTEARFHRSDQRGDVRITEMMYNPLGSSTEEGKERDADAYEFIEIQNVGADDIDLSQAYFEGITYVFPSYTTLRAGEVKVLIRDFGAFRERYPTAEFHGIYEGKLSNRGETITLRDVRGSVLASVSYDDNNGWPVSADGSGDSLVLRNLSGSANNPQNWGVSTNIGGSPGE